MAGRVARQFLFHRLRVGFDKHAPNTFIQIISVAGVGGGIGATQQINPERTYCRGMGLLSLRLSQPLAMR